MTEQAERIRARAARLRDNEREDQAERLEALAAEAHTIRDREEKSN